MPNWNSNSITIQATPEQLVQDGWLVETKNKSYRFNLHKLFPEKYPEAFKEYEDTNTFDDKWDYNWCIQNLGTKWDFEMYHSPVDVDGNFFSCFDTARSPPTELMETFAHQSNLTFELAYDEPGMEFQGTLLSEAGSFSNIQEDYQHSCETCGEKSDDVVYRDRHDNHECNECYKESCSNN